MTATQPPLITGDPLRWPKQPSTRDDAVLQWVALKLMPAIKAWLGKDNMDTDDELTEAIKSVLEDSYDWDGYALAKEFDSQGWSSDAALVDVLSSADHYLYTARNAIVEEWVKAHDVTPKFKVDDAVMVRQGDEGINAGAAGKQIPKGTALNGVIDSIRGHTYTVTIAELGHVRSGDPSGPQFNRTVGSVFRWDHVENSDAACRSAL